MMLFDKIKHKVMIVVGNKDERKYFITSVSMVILLT